MKRAEILDMLNSMNENGELNYSAYSAIFDAVSEMEADVDWIPVKTRQLTPEEKERYPNIEACADFPLPKDGEEILVTVKPGRFRKKPVVYRDRSHIDGSGIWLESGFEWSVNVTAWAHAPAPYEQKEEES